MRMKAGVGCESEGEALVRLGDTNNGRRELASEIVLIKEAEEIRKKGEDERSEGVERG